jgi:hypothetical protein
MGDSNTFEYVIGAMIEGIIDHRLAITLRDIAFRHQRAGGQLNHPLPVGLHTPT